MDQDPRSEATKVVSKPLPLVSWFLIGSGLVNLTLGFFDFDRSCFLLAAIAFAMSWLGVWLAWDQEKSPSK